jgi:hypothetical protein
MRGSLVRRVASTDQRLIRALASRSPPLYRHRKPAAAGDGGAAAVHTIGDVGWLLFGRTAASPPNGGRDAVKRHETARTPAWWDLVNPSAPLGAEDIARLAADVDIDDLDDADWFAVAPALCRWPRWGSTNRRPR